MKQNKFNRYLKIVSIAILLALSFTINTLRAQSPQELWSRQVKCKAGSTNMAVGKTGNSYMLIDNSIYSAIIGASHLTNVATMMLVKYDSTGLPLWWRIIYNTPANVWSTSQQLRLDDSENVYICGPLGGAQLKIGTDSMAKYGDTDSTTTFFAKFNSAGNLKWAIQLGNTHNTYCTDFKLDAHGNIYTFIYSGYDTLNIGSNVYIQKGGLGAALVKIAPNGNVLLCKSIMQGGWAWINVFTLDAPGHVNIAGEYSGTFSLGDSTLKSGPFSRGFVASFDTLGKIMWSQSIGDVVNFIQADAMNNVYVTGTFSIHTRDKIGSHTLISTKGDSLYLARFNPNGLGQWAVQAGINYIPGVTALQMGKDGHIYMAGNFYGTCYVSGTTIINKDYINYPEGMYILNADTAGNTAWLKLIHTNGDGYLTQLDIDKAGHVVAGGTLHATKLKADSISVYIGNYKWSPNTFLVTYNTAGLATSATEAWSSKRASDSMITMQVLPGGNIYTGIITNFYGYSIGNTDTVCFGSADTLVFSDLNRNPGMVRYKSAALGIEPEPAVLHATILLYPNPAQQYVTLVSTTLIKNVDIIDALGRTVKSIQVASNKVNVDLKALSAGMYYLRIYDGENITVKKVIKTQE